jgi:membrane associated rhomboid family serine protease
MNALRLSLLFLFPLALVVGLVVIPVFVAVRQARRNRVRIMVAGQTAEGTISRVTPDSTPGLCQVTFRFRPEGSGNGIECSQRTTLTALQRLKLAVESPVQVRYLPKRAGYAFIDSLVVAERLESLPSARTETALTDDRLTPSVHFVSFSNPSSQLVARNTFRWTSDGDITIGGGVVRFAAQRARPFWFPKWVQKEFPLDAISNVEVFENTVSCEISGGRFGKGTPLQFWAVSSAEANAIGARLPHAKTSVFAPKLAEAAAFQARLVEVTPRVWVTPGLIGINVLLFILSASMGGGILRPNPEVLIRLGSDYTPLTAAGQWWRLITSIFLHFGLAHLAFNMWALWVNGIVVERLYGSTRYLALYLVAGVAGSFASFLWHPFVNGAGASGAIFGVLGALLAYFLRTDSGVPKSVLTTQRNSAAIFIVVSILNAARVQGIDNAAHLGGLAAGFLMGVVLHRPLDPKRDEQNGAAQWLRSIAVVACSVLVVGFYLRSGDWHPRVMHDPSGRPILLTEMTPPTQTYAGVTLGMTPAELTRAKGKPVREKPLHWFYDSVDAQHDGVMEVDFQDSPGGAPPVVWAIVYWGESGAEPPGMASLLGFSRQDLIARYGAPWRESDVGTDERYLFFRNGILVSSKRDKVQAYGLYTSTPRAPGHSP